MAIDGVTEEKFLAIRLKNPFYPFKIMTSIGK